MMRHFFLFSFCMATVFVVSPASSAPAPVAQVLRSVDVLQRAGMVDGWLDKARAFRFVNKVLRANGEKQPLPQELDAIIKPYIFKFMTKDEADALFREVREYYKKTEKSAIKLSLALEKEVFLIDITR